MKIKNKIENTNTDVDTNPSTNSNQIENFEPVMSNHWKMSLDSMDKNLISNKQFRAGFIKQKKNKRKFKIVCNESEINPLNITNIINNENLILTLEILTPDLNLYRIEKIPVYFKSHEYELDYSLKMPIEHIFIFEELKPQERDFFYPR